MKLHAENTNYINENQTGYYTNYLPLWRYPVRNYNSETEKKRVSRKTTGYQRGTVFSLSQLKNVHLISR